MFGETDQAILVCDPRKLARDNPFAGERIIKKARVSEGAASEQKYESAHRLFSSFLAAHLPRQDRSFFTYLSRSTFSPPDADSNY